MRYYIYETQQYRKALKKLSKSRNFKINILNSVVNTIADGEMLDAKYRDHKLSGRLKNFRECHVMPDLLLIYKIEKDRLILILANMGSHSDLFG